MLNYTLSYVVLLGRKVHPPPSLSVPHVTSLMVCRNVSSQLKGRSWQRWPGLGISVQAESRDKQAGHTYWFCRPDGRSRGSLHCPSTSFHPDSPSSFSCACLWCYNTEKDEVLHQIPVLTIQATDPAVGKIAKKKQKPVTFFGCKRGMV